MIKVILFDLDNTLIDRQHIFKEMLMNKLSEYHHNLSKEKLETIVDEIITWDNNGNQQRVITFQQYIDKYHVNTTAKELDDYWTNHSGEKIYVFDDAIETLLYLKSKYRLGLVSNGNAVSQRRKISKLPFKDIFDYSIVSGEIGIHKPDKGIFDKVCKDMNVLPEECVFIGDNFRCDIEGAYFAGMKPIWINKNNDVSSICITIKELQELKGIL